MLVVGLRPSILLLVAAILQAVPAPVLGQADDESSVKLSFPTKRLPDFSFDECMGEKVTLESLKGRPWVTHYVVCQRWTYVRAAKGQPLPAATVS